LFAGNNYRRWGSLSIAIGDRKYMGVSKRVLNWTVAGAIFGYFIIHPGVMFFSHLMHETVTPGHLLFTDFIEETRTAFTIRMLPWAIAISALSAMVSFQYIRLKENKDNYRNLYTDMKGSKDFIENVLDSINEAVSIINVNDLTIAGVNKVFLEDLGLREKEVLGQPCYKITHHKNAQCSEPEHHCPLSETLKTKEHAIAEHTHYKHNGEEIIVEVETSPIFDEKNNVSRVVHIARDITEKKMAQEKVESSEKRFRTLFNNTNDAIYLWEFKEKGVLRCLEANKKAIKMLGYERDEFLSMNPSDINSEETISEVPGNIDTIIGKGHHTFEAVHLTKYGVKIPVEISSHVFELDGKTVVLSMARDISGRKKQEQIIKETVEKYQNLFENMEEGFAYHEIVLDENQKPVDYIFLEANEAFERFTGLKRADIIGKRVTDVIPGIQNAKPDLISVYGKVALTGKPDNFEIYFEPFDKWYYVSIYSHEKGYFAVNFIDITESKIAGDTDMALARLSNALLTSTSIKEIADLVLESAKELTGSDHGYVTSIDQATGDNVGHTLTDMLGEDCRMQVYGSDVRFPKGPDGYGGLWGHALNTKESFFTNSPEKHESSKGLPEGHVPLKNFLTVPALLGRSLVGQIALSNSDKPYTERDLETIKRLAELYAIALRQKQSEEQIKSSLGEKEVLLREVHHRVKNNLQVISSLLSLQSSSNKDLQQNGVFKESQDRIKAMAFVHEKLYQSKTLDGIDFHGYLKTLTTNLVHSYSTDSKRFKIKMDIENVSMKVDTAIPSGLIINELITNSMKHAFTENGGGEIRIDFHKEKDGKYILSISDNGVGLPENFDMEDSESLGLNLVKMLVEQLEGTISIDSSDGARFDIQLSDKDIGRLKQ
jgi:PAS domain S-box-containing protein